MVIIVVRLREKEKKIMTEALLKEWKRQAKKDNLLDDYEYHLGMFENPLPYRQWKLKLDALTTIQNRPDYFSNLPQHLIDRETELCNALGY
jgi:hypothetical protein